MSLDYRLDEIKSFKELCFRENEMNPVTKRLIFATVTIGASEITKNNWRKFYARLNFTERVYGQYLTRDGQPRFIQPEEVKKHIGLSTNARAFSETAFLSNFTRKLIDMEQEAEQEEGSRQ